MKRMLAAGALVLSASMIGICFGDGPSASPRIDSKRSKIVTTYFSNDTGLDIKLCISGIYGTESVDISKSAPYPTSIRFYDDGTERVISAFARSQTSVVCMFQMTPGNFCVILEKGATLVKTTADGAVAQSISPL